MSALSTFLAEVGDEEKARFEDVDGKRVLYVAVKVFRQHLSTVTSLVKYPTEIDYAVLVNHGHEKIELHPIRKLGSTTTSTKSTGGGPHAK